MKYLILILTYFLAVVEVFAQDCSTELLKQKPGIWKANPPGSTIYVPAADLVKQKKVVAAIHAMIQSKYSPIAVEAGFSGGYSRPYENMPGNGYDYAIIPLEFYCDGKLIKKVGETGTYFSIAANMFSAEIYDSVQGDRLSGEGFNVMNDMPIKKDGYWYFKEWDVSLAFGIEGKKSMWLVTYDGKLPFAYVTKKEFLVKRRKALPVLMNFSAFGFKDALRNNEMTKGFKETEYKNDPAKLEHYMKMDYQQIKQRYEKFLAETEKDYKPAFDKIDKQLKMSEAELNEQAIVKIDPKDHLSYLFTNDDDPFGKILIKPNPGYFNRKLPKSSPQFFSIFMTGCHTEPVAAKFMTDIIKAVDFSQLKNMLGK